MHDVLAVEGRRDHVGLGGGVGDDALLFRAFVFHGHKGIHEGLPQADLQVLDDVVAEALFPGIHLDVEVNLVILVRDEQVRREDYHAFLIGFNGLGKPGVGDGGVLEPDLYAGNARALLIDAGHKGEAYLVLGDDGDAGVRVVGPDARRRRQPGGTGKCV